MSVWFTVIVDQEKEYRSFPSDFQHTSSLLKGSTTIPKDLLELYQRLARLQKFKLHQMLDNQLLSYTYLIFFWHTCLKAPTRSYWRTLVAQLCFIREIDQFNAAVFPVVGNCGVLSSIKAKPMQEFVAFVGLNATPSQRSFMKP
ncbi:uncharacterized protein LOC111892878 [Lactuca sativa]|uniref:uncharacterized protein LOC111892878 n=1 Tax=Lactuca sativa TaxID=4236 RepID=UPI001C68787E|nr:uncharacterized protein LOC111892878 [Lactuca sativa]